MKSSSVTEKVYEYITEKSDNSCEEIPDIACREAPGSFILNAANGTLTKLAEAVASPGLVLPWLLASAGVLAIGLVFVYPVSLVMVSLCTLDHE